MESKLWKPNLKIWNWKRACIIKYFLKISTLPAGVIKVSYLLEASEFDATKRSPPVPDPERALNNNIRNRDTVEVPNKIRVFVSDPILTNPINYNVWVSWSLTGNWKFEEAKYLNAYFYCSTWVIPSKW